MFNIQEEEEREFCVASEAQADYADVLHYAFQHQDQEWVLSDRDVWYHNPYYTGPETPHPEMD